MIPAIDTAAPVIEAVCTLETPQRSSPQAACLVIAAQRGNAAGLGFLLTTSGVRVQFIGVWDPEGGLLVTHVSFGSGRLIEVTSGSCDILGDTITCHTPGMTMKAVVQ